MLKQLAFAALATAALSSAAISAAEAAPLIAFVASNGNDANLCTVVTAPCKTLQRAVNVTAANGTVRVLTPLQNNAVITKNITISGDGAPIVGIIVINSSTAVVTLRGLALNGIGSFANGIRIDSAAAVHIEDCTVERYTGNGIHLGATSFTRLFVSDTVSRDNGGSGLSVSDTNAQVAVENSRFENNAVGGLYLAAAAANVTRSAASSNNNYGIWLTGGTTNVTETTVADNYNYGFVVTSGGGATLDASVARGNTYGLVVALDAQALITDSVFTYNGGASIINGGTLYTRQNNTLGTAYSGNGTLAPVTAF